MQLRRFHLAWAPVILTLCSCEVVRKLADAQEKLSKANDKIAEAQQDVSAKLEETEDALSQANALVNRVPSKLSADSDTEQCRSDLLAGVQYFADQNGMPIKTGDEQIQALVTDGSVELGYARDAVRYTLSFGLFESAQGCDLDIYQRVTEKPGHRQVDYNDYGLFSLESCNCKG